MNRLGFLIGSASALATAAVAPFLRNKHNRKVVWTTESWSRPTDMVVFHSLKDEKVVAVCKRRHDTTGNVFADTMCSGGDIDHAHIIIHKPDKNSGWWNGSATYATVGLPNERAHIHLTTLSVSPGDSIELSMDLSGA